MMPLSDEPDRKDYDICDCGHTRLQHMKVCYHNECNCIKFTLDTVATYVETTLDRIAMEEDSETGEN